MEAAPSHGSTANVCWVRMGSDHGGSCLSPGSREVPRCDTETRSLIMHQERFELWCVTRGGLGPVSFFCHDAKGMEAEAAAPSEDLSQPC